MNIKTRLFIFHIKRKLRKIRKSDIKRRKKYPFLNEEPSSLVLGSSGCGKSRQIEPNFSPDQFIPK